MLKRLLKRVLLKRKNVFVDSRTNINFNMNITSNEAPIRIKDSNLEIRTIGQGCFIEHCTMYGNINLGDFVSISGPGTILHSEIGCIRIGSYTSIAENVSIQEFNHFMERPTTCAVNHMIFHSCEDDFTSKGDILIGEDVWIGSNAVLLSGVKIGRGAIIAAGAIVTKDVPSYAVVGGNPARLIKMRFSEPQIELLERSEWWKWDYNKKLNNKSFFENKVGFYNEFE